MSLHLEHEETSDHMAQTPTSTTAAPKRKTAATQRSTAAKRAAATRAKKTAQTAPVVKTPIDRAQEYAEKAVLIPVGAALVARDRVVTSVNDVITNYSTRTKAETQLKRFERRGVKARNELERDVRKTRTRVERELRQRRRRVERTLTRLDRRSSTVTKNVSAQVEQVQAQVENAVQSGITAGTELATKVQERVLNVA
jgi:hypothetical protein